MRRAPSKEDREVIRQAARWLALLESAGTREDDHPELQRWRDSSTSHEHAWQKAQQLRERFRSVPSGLAMSTLDRPDQGRRALLKRALGIAALVPTAWLLSRQLPVDVWRADLHTSTGERRKLPLAAGSLLQLNTDSAVNLDLGNGVVTLLRGEIALSVPGDAALAIEAPYGRILVGRSEVCVRLNSNDCQVSVLRGTVQLQPLRGVSVDLHAGQQASLALNGAGPIGAFDVSSPGWREGVLAVQDQALGDFLRDLSRYRAGLLRWEPELENLRVTGTFRLDDTNQILSLLAASLPVEVQMRSRYWVTLRPRKAFAQKNSA